MNDKDLIVWLSRKEKEFAQVYDKYRDYIENNKNYSSKEEYLKLRKLLNKFGVCLIDIQEMIKNAK